MCQFCSDARVNGEQLFRVRSNEGWTCDEEGCDNEAVSRTVFGYVDDHYCDGHRNPKHDLPALEIAEPTFEYAGDYLLRIRVRESCAGPILGPT